jgi:hypothetical protein
MLGTCLWEYIPLDAMYLPQILLGIGYSMVDIPLLVSVQASCIKRSDVSIATALIMVCKEIAFPMATVVTNAIADQFGPLPLKPLDFLKPNAYYGIGTGVERDYTREVWCWLIILGTFSTGISIVTAAIGIENVNLPFQNLLLTCLFCFVLFCWKEGVGYV